MWRKVNPVTLFEILVIRIHEQVVLVPRDRASVQDGYTVYVASRWRTCTEQFHHIEIHARTSGRGNRGSVYQFVAKLCEMGEVKFKNLFVDGTKIEAYANKYTHVWENAMERTSPSWAENQNGSSVIAERYGLPKMLPLKKTWSRSVPSERFLDQLLVIEY